MIYLAITPAGLVDARRAAAVGDTVWCGADAISQDDYAAIPAGDRPSRFIHELGDGIRLQGALDTIQEHHPGQTIWIESPLFATAGD